MKQAALKIIAIALLIGSMLATGPLVFGKARPVSIKSAPSFTGQISQAIISSRDKSLIPVAGKDYNLAGTRYFEEGAWVVTEMVPTSNNLNTGWVVLQKQGGVYEIVLGPGSSFPSNATHDLPAEVSKYLNLHGVLYSV